MNKTLLIGPFSPPITGVSFANDILFKELRNNGIEIESINFSYPTLKENIGKFSSKKALFYIKLYFYLYKIPNFDVIYMTPGQTFLGILKYYPFIFISKIFNKDTIIHIHGNHLWKEYENLKGLKKKIFHQIISKFDKGIVLSPKLRKNLRPFIKDKNIYEVYNFVENNILNNISIKNINNKNTNELNIVYLSNLMKEKGIFDLLNALLLLRKKKIKFKVRIAGAIDSSEEYNLNKLFQQLKGDVEYLGVVKANDKLKLLINSNIFILPTYYSMEGQPISILEAMATGNIILTTNHAGISDIFVNSKNGFFIKKNNPKQIANKLEELNISLKDHQQIMINNFKEAQEKYTTERFINNIIEVINKVRCKN